jgi:hypothetical protein
MRAAGRAGEGGPELGDRFGGQAGEFSERVLTHDCADGRHGLPVPAVVARHYLSDRIPGHGGAADLAWVSRRPACHVEPFRRQHDFDRGTIAARDIS